MDVVNFQALRRGGPQFADHRLIRLAGRIIFDHNVAEAVFLGKLRHHFRLAKVALILGGRADKLIRDQFEHMMQGALAGNFINNRRHLLM